MNTQLDVAHIPFQNSFAGLPDRFYARVRPTPVSHAQLVRLNLELALHLGLDAEVLASPSGIEMLGGTRIPEGVEPIAMAYAGHQFGQFVPQLGDGRAILLGEVVDREGVRRDIQLKGAGPTPFSRRGDGRAALGPVLREYLVSEAMAALHIPTTRALAAVTTGETVARERPVPGAVLTRVASSHIRVGTFQYLAARGDAAGVRLLADYVIDRHYPQAATSDQPYRALLEGVIARQAELVSHWLLVGFIHGVMNTDNMSIAGETIDYGPCAFMDAYHPATVFSSIDQHGRYAYANQPRMAHWNLARLAEALLPLLAEGEDEAVAAAQTALEGFVLKFGAAFQAGMRRKLGLFSQRDDDSGLAQDLLDAMTENHADFTLTFRLLSAATLNPADDGPIRRLFTDPTAFDRWASRWRLRLAQEPHSLSARQAAMRAVNPAYIPRNHRVEAAIQAAMNQNFLPFEELLMVGARPFEDQPALAHYADPPAPHERVEQTFCGT